MELKITEKVQNSDVKKENITFRYLYGFAILFVVMSHCDGGGFEMMSNWIHFGAFHLGIFVFGSGYFFKKDNGKKPLQYVIKKICKLLVPLWIFHGLYGLILIGLHNIGFSFGGQVNLKTWLLNPVYSQDLYTLNMGAWFLFPFFMVQIIYIAGKSIFTLLREKEWIGDLCWQIFLFTGGLFIISFACKGYEIPGAVVTLRIAYFMPFYILGMWYKSIFEKYMSKLSATLILVLSLLATLVINTYFGRVVYAIPSSCDYPFGPVATYLTAVIGIVFWLTVSGELAKFSKTIRPLQILGNDTFDIMIHQFMGILLLKCIFAMGNGIFGIFPDFDYGAFYSDIWYLYLPGGLAEYKALYVVFAIGFSIMVGKFVKILKKKILLCKPGKI